MVAAVDSPSATSSHRRSRRFSAPSADVAERQARGGPRQVQLDYAFDRLRATKLAHAYEILVPARARSCAAHVKECPHAAGRDLRPGLLGAAARGAHDREPDDGVDRICEDAQSGGADGLDLRRPRLYPGDT